MAHRPLHWIPAPRPGTTTATAPLPGSVRGSALEVEGDAVRLAQVFTNLLNNAARYGRRGGQVHLRARREGGWGVVSVRDEGVGIPTEQLRAIFDLFTQPDRERDGAQPGLGIGLSLVRSLVQRHGGEVEARSEGPGRGAEFVVRLPLRAGA